MRGEGGLLRLGEYLVGRACRGLPAEERDERYREWTAELPAILHDPGIRLPWHRAARMLSYAAGVPQGTALPSGQRMPRWVVAVIVVELGIFASNIWVAVRSPADWINDVLAVWSLGLIAAFIGVYRYRINRRGGRADAHRN
jgi:hypothetical protein